MALSREDIEQPRKIPPVFAGSDGAPQALRSLTKIRVPHRPIFSTKALTSYKLVGVFPIAKKIFVLE